MNTISKRFLEALKASLLKQNIDWTNMSRNEWRALFQLANSQGLLPMIYQATYNCPSLQEYSDMIKSYFTVVSEQVAMQVMKTAEFLDVYQKLSALGVKPLIVKGLICRQLYPLPDYRPSTDEDVLILPEQFEECHNEFLNYGMHLLEEDEDIMAAYEVAYWKSPTLLYIELHKSLFRPESDTSGNFNRFFEGAHERAMKEMVHGVSVFTLNHTEHLLYLICHAFKHFLGSGVGIRQVCDITLFANQYGKDIDWKFILECCEEINADGFVATVFQIGEKYLTFNPEQACYPDAFHKLAIDEEDLLDDILEGGVLGNVNLSRIHSGNITLNAVTANKYGKKSKGLILKTIFPTKREMVKIYKYLEKHPFLLPIAWTSRIFRYLGEVDKKYNDPGMAVRIGTQRVELLKKYGVIK